MIKLPTDLSYDDISQWLDGGFVMTDCGLRAFECSEDEGVRLEDDDGCSGVYDLHEVSIHWPLCGAVNLDINGHYLGVYLERRQHRQWRRTFNTRELSLVIPNMWEYLKNGGRPYSSARSLPAWAVARACFEPEYPDMEEAQELLAGGVHSVALSRYVLVTRRSIYNRDRLAAHYEGRRIYPVAGRREVQRLMKLFGGYNVANN